MRFGRLGNLIAKQHLEELAFNPLLLKQELPLLFFSHHLVGT